LNNMLLYHAKKNKRKVNISDSLNKDLCYSFRFRDISKEAIMALAKNMRI